jgi:hypothetical protein
MATFTGQACDLAEASQGEKRQTTLLALENCANQR